MFIRCHSETLASCFIRISIHSKTIEALTKPSASCFQTLLVDELAWRQRPQVGEFKFFCDAEFVGLETFCCTYAGISGQPEGATPGQPTGNPGAWQGICSKGMPHTRGIRALLRFWQNTPGPYPRDLHVICCLNVQRFSPQDKQARSIDILRQLSLSKLNSNSS